MTAGILSKEDPTFSRAREQTRDLFHLCSPTLTLSYSDSLKEEPPYTKAGSYPPPKGCKGEH